MRKYKAYCRELAVPTRTEKEASRSIFGIGCTTKAVGTAIVSVQLKDLNMIIYVKIQISGDNVQTVLSMEDMVDKEIDISI